ncbi:MAG: hypothetical protein IJ343_02945 [Clostridia bacterium]|nr:hypothetical protein [Clostridia bacterium]
MLLNSGVLRMIQRQDGEELIRFVKLRACLKQIAAMLDEPELMEAYAQVERLPRGIGINAAAVAENDAADRLDGLGDFMFCRTFAQGREFAEREENRLIQRLQLLV